MKKRSPITVFLLGFITLFIYSWYWQVKTKGEMNKLGEKIPTAFIWLIPIVGSIWWAWKYAEGVEHVTHEKLSAVVAFLVMWLLGPIGHAIIQDSFNKIQPVAATAPAAPVYGQPAAMPPAPAPFVGAVGPTVAPVAPSPAVPPTSSQEPPTFTPPPAGPPVVGG